MKKGHIAATFLALLAAVLLVVSFVFIAHEADHDCSGEDCPVCAQIAVCVDAFRAFSNTIVVCAFAACVCCIALLTFRLAAWIGLSTPVSLKVKKLN